MQSYYHLKSCQIKYKRDAKKNNGKLTKPTEKKTKQWKVIKVNAKSHAIYTLHVSDSFTFQIEISCLLIIVVSTLSTCWLQSNQDNYNNSKKLILFYREFLYKRTLKSHLRQEHSMEISIWSFVIINSNYFKHTLGNFK